MQNKKNFKLYSNPVKDSMKYNEDDAYSCLDRNSSYYPINQFSRDEWVSRNLVTPIIQKHYYSHPTSERYQPTQRKRRDSSYAHPQWSSHSSIPLSPYKKSILIALYLFFPLVPLTDLYIQSRRWIALKIIFFNLFCILTYYFASITQISVFDFLFKSLKYLMQAGLFPFNDQIFQNIFHFQPSPNIINLYLGFIASFIINFFIHYTGLIGTLIGIKKDGNGQLIYYL